MESVEFCAAFPKLTRRLGDDDTARFIAGVRETEVASGAVLVDESTPADSLYLILDGEFRVVVPHAGGELEIGRLGPGKLIGEAPLFGDDHMSASRVVAVSDARVVAIGHQQYWSWWQDNPDLASVMTREFIDHMSERVRTADEMIKQRLQ